MLRDELVIELASPSLVLLVGPTGAGKSSFAARHFAPTQVVSSDRCRAAVCDSETDMTANDDAFAVVDLIVARRLSRRRLTVVDATSVTPSARASLVALARERAVPVIAIALDVPLEVLERRLATRGDRPGLQVVTLHRQRESSLQSLRPGVLEAEGISRVHVLGLDQVERVRVVQVRA